MAISCKCLKIPIDGYTLECLKWRLDCHVSVYLSLCGAFCVQNGAYPPTVNRGSARAAGHRRGRRGNVASGALLRPGQPGRPGQTRGAQTHAIQPSYIIHRLSAFVASDIMYSTCGLIKQHFKKTGNGAKIVSKTEDRSRSEIRLFNRLK